MENELMPCPFCGGEPILQEQEAHEHSPMLKAMVPGIPDHPGSWTVECCDVGMIKDTRAEVVAAWNRRATPATSAPSGEVAPVPAVVWDVKAIRDIAEELEMEASNYEGDFADTVNGCASALHALADAHHAAAPASAQHGEDEPPLPEAAGRVNHDFPARYVPYWTEGVVRQYGDARAAHAVAQLAHQVGDGVRTDLSVRLRETADQHPGWRSLLTQAADEIERYYGGMLNWKRAAEAKDATLAHARAATTIPTSESIDTPEFKNLMADYRTGWADGYAEIIAHINAWHAAGVEKAREVSEGFVLVRKPKWADAKPTDEGEFVCCGGYTPCRGQCAAYVSTTPSPAALTPHDADIERMLDEQDSAQAACTHTYTYLAPDRVQCCASCGAKVAGKDGAA